MFEILGNWDTDAVMGLGMLGLLLVMGLGRGVIIICCVNKIDVKIVKPLEF